MRCVADKEDKVVWRKISLGFQVFAQVVGVYNFSKDNPSLEMPRQIGTLQVDKSYY